MHQSEATLRVKLSHALPALRAVPPEALLTVQLGWEAGHRLGLELQVGACELQGSGELHLDRGLRWQVLAQSSCEALQVGGTSVWGGSGPQGLEGAGQGPSFRPLEKQGGLTEPQRKGLIKYLLSPLCALEIQP